MEKIRKSINEKDIYTGLSVVIIGLIAHVYILTHNIILHDNTYNFFFGASYTSGRWMLDVIMRVTNFLNRSYVHFATPTYLGVLCIIYIAIAAIILERIFKVESKVACCLIGGIMVSFPVVTSLMGFMFTSAVNMFGMVLSIIGAAVIIRYKKWYSYIIGVGILACAMGSYQAYVCTFVCTFLIYFFLEIIDCTEEKFFKWFFIKIAYYGGACLASLVLYLGVMKFFLWHYHAQLNDYQGMNTASSTSLSQYLTRIGTAYKEFFAPVLNSTRNMYQGGNYYLYYVTLALTALLSFLVIFNQYRKDIKKGIVLTLLLLLLPLGVNFVYVMCDDNVHSLMMYSECFLFIFALLLAQRVELPRAKKTLSLVLSLTLGIMILFNCRFSNTAYLRGEYIQNAGIEYFNRMVTKIESAPGYTPDKYVAFIGDPVADQNVFLYQEFGTYINVYPFSLNTIINNYNWQTFMKATVGFNPNTVGLDYLKDHGLVDEMPSYPAEGSIKVIDDVVVVKFQ